MSAALDTLRGLERERPEWKPWLAVVDEVVREATGARWADTVPRHLAPAPGAPLLAGAPLAMPAAIVRSWMERLLRVASRSDTAAMKNLAAAGSRRLDATDLFTASLAQDDDRIAALAAAAAVDPEALHAVAALLPVPFLVACNRQWSAERSAGWGEPYCHTCGAWPAFVEVRGIERNRYCRCGRCGGEWLATALLCAFCGERDHDALVALVPQGSGASGTVEACTACRGYMKTFTKLQGCAPEEVLLEDLKSVALDVAALDQGYQRPAGAGFPCEAASV
jgi:FdhE protein